MAKKKTQELESGVNFGDWILDEEIGEGGNGFVWKARKKDGADHAIKVLKKTDPLSLKRFQIEIEVLEKKLIDVEGIIPLIEQSFSKENKGEAWFVMPLAISFANYVQDKSSLELADDFYLLGKTLADLHGMDFSHRDIKPDNFLFFKDRLCLSDFGLVKYPERDANLTEDKRDVGAKFTMAPEMRREGSKADGKPADVFSFAKSFWIALTGVKLGFDGQYNPRSTLSLSNYVPGLYTSKLDQLLVDATENDPIKRPSMDQFLVRFEEWIALAKDYHTRNLIEWAELSAKLFPSAAPAHAEWTGLESIIAILSEITKNSSLNHMFYPDGGGNTIVGVNKAAETGMLELYTEGSSKSADLLKPLKLTYVSFGNETMWSYFRLEANCIKSSRVYSQLPEGSSFEELTEISPTKYAELSCWLNDEFKGEPLPSEARRICRYLKGCFVFFSNQSIYNGAPETYDGRHNKMSETDFRMYIQRQHDNWLSKLEQPKLKINAV